MRFFSLLAAVALAGIIYAFVLERERLLAFLPAPGGVAENGEQAARTAVTTDTANAGADQDEAGEMAPMRVVAVHSKARRIDGTVLLRGATEADREANLRAETSGQIISKPIRKGSFVEAGQVLCEIDPASREVTLSEMRARLREARSRVPEAEAQVPEAEARVEEARARVTEAEARLEEARINANAARSLVQDGFASQTRVANTAAAVRGAEAAIVSARAQLRAAESGLERVAAGIEAARAGVESARAAVAAAEAEIGRLTISAPFSGILENDTAELGNLLRPGDLCATVIQLDPIIMVGFVPETAVNRIRMGARAEARLGSDQSVEGEVTFISRAADETTRTFRVEIEVSNPDLRLRDGQTAEITIAAEGRLAHLLPQSALTLDDDGTMGVRIVVRGNAASFHPVKLLRDTPDGAWMSGLPDTADVIIIGQEYVTDGAPVAPVFTEVGQ